jgi:hypothetical protein
MEIVSLFNNAVDYIFAQLFGNLLTGQAVNNPALSIIGAFFLLLVLFFSRKLFKKLYITFAFLFAVVSITVLGADLHGYKYGRYIFVPTIVIFCIFMYEGREVWQNRKKQLFSIAKIALFALFFLLISVRIVRNYLVSPLVSHPWKSQAALFDPQGNVFYHFPINPVYWSVAIPSSTNREDYVPASSTRIAIDNSHIIKIKDIQQNDNLFTITGPSPEITYQLPETASIVYCSLDFGYPLEIKIGLICFLPEKGETFMLFHVEEKNLIAANGNMLATEVKQVRFNFFETLLGDSFVIKQISFYTVVTEESIQIE